jgi:hypothetical protein
MRRLKARLVVVHHDETLENGAGPPVVAEVDRIQDDGSDAVVVACDHTQEDTCSGRVLVDDPQTIHLGEAVEDDGDLPEEDNTAAVLLEMDSGDAEHASGERTVVGGLTLLGDTDRHPKLGEVAVREVVLPVSASFELAEEPRQSISVQV